MFTLGELDKRISVLALDKEENVYTWETSSKIWAKVEPLNSTNIFSKVGLGAKSIKFTIRINKNITLHNAFLWQDEHCFLTNISEIDKAYYEVITALVKPVICTVKREGELTLNDLNRPVYGHSEIITFPGCLTEKYLGHTQERPIAITEVRYVLVTPKLIELRVGEVVNIGNKPYTVLIPHVLDEYKNEYEIMAKEDA